MTLPLADDRKALLDDIAYCDRALQDSQRAQLDGRCVDPVAAAEKRARLTQHRAELQALLDELDQQVPAGPDVGGYEPGDPNAWAIREGRA